MRRERAGQHNSVDGQHSMSEKTPMNQEKSMHHEKPMNTVKRWLRDNWKMTLGVALALALWTTIALNTGQGGLGF
ncbi:hypothetical protein [Deinococcus marmoris]|uniref:Uncharacterized protein n=1 Tax=Deinococcus marmoris TaxID=249408 RepID=A0A1U7NY37_9DEIO|nr:hypothetical protein [Deinococcus marmoris]OLV17832.1 hypothetical protein BOO71_0007645 [Deinococcus marmoris]